MSYKLICKECSSEFATSHSNRQFCSSDCYHKHDKGIPRKEARKEGITSQGYIRLTNDMGERVLKHRQIYEDYYNIKLTSYQIIHHINGIKTDNRIENLELVKGIAGHNKAHGGHIRWKESHIYCPKGHDKEGSYYCPECNRIRAREYYARQHGGETLANS